MLLKIKNLYSILPGKLWIPETQEKHDYKYLILDSKYVNLKGRKAVLLVAIVLMIMVIEVVIDAILADSESTNAYWSLLVRLCKKFDLKFVIDLNRSIDCAVFGSNLRVIR
ncbi:hypothetical protein V6M85_07475 [Sulfolobus tengchongensis]|uniref:Transposase n=1 Tax=Sulfolobus tengchongensis TaxID=207809 RepID=A0AAX4KYN0_9CREN